MKRNSFLFLAYFLVTALFGLVALSVQHFPVFTLNILMICTGIICYVLTEYWTTHDAIEFENRFWTFMAGMIARACVFCSDSPFRLPDERSGLGWGIVLLTAYVAHIYDRHLRRLVLSRVPNIPRVKSSVYDLSSRVNARSKLAELRKLQDMLDNKFISSTFQNIFNLGKVLHIENQILNIFLEADKDELNLILSTAELGHIFYKVKDHKFVQQFNRTKLLQTLAVDRLYLLNVTARAMVLDAFQKMKLSAHAKSDFFVKNIITSTKGDQLSELKSLSDCKGDINSFHKLIYRDIENVTEKKEILNHIQKQAKIQASHNMIGTRTGKQRGLMAWRKILSDVDDTLSCSGGVWPAGIDTRYPRRVVYPGVLSFYRELDLGVTGDESWDSNARVGNLVFLSARPHVYKEVSETHTYAKFRDLQEKSGLYTSPTLLAGSLSTGTNFMVGGNPEPLALKKFENLKEYLHVYPEFSCIIIGDNGQGDVRTAEMVKDDKNLRGNLTRTYIHQVQPLHQTYTSHTHTKQSTNNDICYFTNYIEAAIDAYANKLIRLSGLRRIASEAVTDFGLISAEAWAGAQATGLVVTTSSSVTESEKRVFDANGSAKDVKTSKHLGHEHPKLIPVYNPELKVDARMRELNLSLYRANKLLVAEGMSSVKLMRFPCRFQVGSLVRTVMGNGVVTRFRGLDGVYEVLLQWDATGRKAPVKAFLQGSAIKLIPAPLNPSSHVRRFRGSAPPIVLRSAVSTPQLSRDSIAKTDFWSSSLISSNRSSPAPTPTAHSAPKSNLTLAAVARHTIIAGTTQMTTSGSSTAKPLKPSEVPFEKALEMAFIPSALARSSGNNMSNMSSTGGTGVGRARTMSTSSDDKVSSTLTGHVKDPNDRMSDCRGSIAWTPYGLGVVKDYREKGDFILLTLSWARSATIQRTQIVQLTDPADTLYMCEVRAVDEEPIPIAETVSLVHDSSGLALPVVFQKDRGERTAHRTKEEVNPESALEIASIAVKKDSRPSIFPSWLPIWGSKKPSAPSVANMTTASVVADRVDSTDETHLTRAIGVDVAKKRYKYSEFNKLVLRSSFGAVSIVNISVSGRASDGVSRMDLSSGQTFSHIIIEVEFMQWQLAGNAQTFAKGFLSPHSIYVQQTYVAAKRGVATLAPIGEEVPATGMPLHRSCLNGLENDQELIRLSLHPLFIKLFNNYD